jgi:hypothetical protein
MKNKKEIFVETYFRSLNKVNEVLCGDKVEVRRNEDSFIVVLADGLGSGVKANILSTLTSTIISEMIYSGSTMQEVVETITATLPECKSRGVAYSTFTIAQVYDNGTCKLVEFDNPDTIVMRDNEVLALTKDIYRIGNRTIKEVTFEVLPEDLIIFFSDGIIHAGLGEILNLGWEHHHVVEFLKQYCNPGDSAKEVNRLLLAEVNDLYGGEPKDDSTVAVLKVVEKETSMVMVGPPVNELDDVKIVNKLIKCKGRKIVCGGTTANIVARELSEKISMDTLIEICGDVPPIAYIKGIDLVTEGVITLGKVDEYLSECIHSDKYKEELLNSKAKDGAVTMVKMLLLNCSEIVFMVGTSDNPAHKGIAYTTISLSGKLRLMDKIAKNLRELGKIVKIEKY